MGYAPCLAHFPHCRELNTAVRPSVRPSRSLLLCSGLLLVAAAAVTALELRCVPAKSGPGFVAPNAPSEPRD